MQIYTTVSGDTWDAVSYKMYGDESHIQELMQANISILDITVFSAGTEIIIPEITLNEDDSLPEWRRFVDE